MSKACELFGITRQAIYQQEKRQRQRIAVLRPVNQMVQKIRQLMPRIGTRKLYGMIKPELTAKGIKLGRDGLFDFLRARHLLIKPKRSYTKTTYSRHWMKKHPNLFADMVVSRPEQAFVSDITYVESDEGVHYLSLVTDACFRKIMGYELSHTMKASDTVKALRKAAANRTTTEPLIHHSDRGSQYCSELYQKELRKHDIDPSMTDGYDCYQNAMAERINGILKQEFLLYRCKTFEDLKVLVAESINTYNAVRPHLSLGMKTPEQVHTKTAA